MAIEAVAAGGARVVGGVQAIAGVKQLDSVMLWEMIRAQIGGQVGVAGIGGLALGSVPTITPAGTAGVTSSTHVPELLQQFGNGRVPRELLTLIGIGQHRLWGPAAESFIAMRAAAADAGVAISVTDSYRNYDQQVDLAERKGLTINGGLAATPGKSEHGWGLAVDADVDGAGLAWLKANAAEFGWVMPTTREPWHWEFHGET